MSSLGCIPPCLFGRAGLPIRGSTVCSLPQHRLLSLPPPTPVSPTPVLAPSPSLLLFFSFFLLLSLNSGEVKVYFDIYFHYLFDLLDAIEMIRRVTFMHHLDSIASLPFVSLSQWLHYLGLGFTFSSDVRERGNSSFVFAYFASIMRLVTSLISVLS